MKQFTGRCLCGAVAYAIQGELGPIYNCHCQRCRRWHGSAFRTRAAVETKNFSWTQGEEHISKYGDGVVVRTFCSICGSALISLINDNPDFIGLPLGGLEQDPGHRPIAHLFVGSKSPWYDITDNLPQYDEWPGGSPDVVRGIKK